MADHHVTDAHYRGIGQIAGIWAAVEALMLFTLGAMMKIDDEIAVATFWHMGFNDRRDRLINLVNVINMLPEEPRAEFDCLIARLNTAARLRNVVVHSVWAKSPQPNAITPHVVIAKGGKKVKQSGVDMPDEHFTPERLAAEAAKIRRLSQDFHEFAEKHFGLESLLEEELEP